MDTMSYVFISAMLVIIALVMFFVSLPLIRGRIAMNKTYGIRIPKAFESKANWYTINKFGGKQLTICSSVFAVAGVLFGILQPALTAWSFWVLSLTPFLLLVIAFWRIKSFAAQLP